MATIRAYTDLPQSRKLAEILPPESADMSWKNGVSDKYIQCFTPFIINDYRSNVDYDYDVPCWSLTALLSVLPRPSLHQTKDKRWYCIAEPNRLYFSEHYNNPVDACYEMILKLKELKML